MTIFATSSAISVCHSGKYLGKTPHYRTFTTA